MLLWASRQLICNLVCAGAKGLACAQSATAHKALLAARHYSSKYSTTKAPYDPLPPGWEGVIGIEVHAQLKSARKLFSPAPVEGLSLTANDNDLVAPLDAALPGTLPSLQSEPLHLALRTALALDCEIASTVSFDRKHYFYSDLTSGYQITQKYAPLARNGVIRLLQDDGYLADKKAEATVRIEQIQLEQDTAKSTLYRTHESQATLVDLNRAGSALIEIVSGPDMKSAEQAGAYIRKLREILRRIGASDGNMDEGSLRCDVNVSINKVEEPWGVRCEIKNLNSIKFVMRAIGYEMHRQYQLLSSGKQVEQETRSYDEIKGLTTSMRSKEDSPDYRYMPDPNLPALHISAEVVKDIQNSMPELIEHQRDRIVRQYKLPVNEVNILIRIGLEEERGEIDAVIYFEQVAMGRNAKIVLNWIIQILVRSLNDQGKAFVDNTIDPKHLGQIIDLVESAKLTSSIARAFIKELLQDAEILKPYHSDNAVFELLSSRGVLAMGSSESLRDLCQEAIKNLPEESQKIRQGNEKIVKRLVGEVMKRSKGRADAKAAQEELLKLLRS